MTWLNRLSLAVRDERVILVTIGLATFGLVSSMMTVLTRIRDNNEIVPAEPKTQYITQETEDSLELDTLATLLQHPSYPIRDVAVKILCDRAINDDSTTMTLLWGITRPDYEERMKNLRALGFLTTQTIGQDGMSKLDHPKAYSALVRSLELCLDDADPPEMGDRHWDEYYLRDMSERLCLMFILELIAKHGPNRLIKARFVERWLAKQKWGDTPEDRQRNFSDYHHVKTNRIADIINLLRHSRRGLNALEEAGLVSRDSDRQQRAREGTEHDHEEGEGEGEGGEGQEGQSSGPESASRRTMEHSVEEQRLRRQNREAMVLNDGSRPLRREDIIEVNDGAEPS